MTKPRRKPYKRPKRDVETQAFIEELVTRLILRAGVRAGDADEVELAALIALHSTVDQAIASAVAGQRSRGVSWAGIGRGTGTTRQAAQQRWGTSS